MPKTQSVAKVFHVSNCEAGVGSEEAAGIDKVKEQRTREAFDKASAVSLNKGDALERLLWSSVLETVEEVTAAATATSVIKGEARLSRLLLSLDEKDALHHRGASTFLGTPIAGWFTIFTMENPIKQNHIEPYLARYILLQPSQNRPHGT